MTQAIKDDVVGSKEFTALQEIVRYEGCIDLITKSNDELEHVYTTYYVEKKKRLAELKKVEEYDQVCQDIKAVKSAMRERIAPEAALFDLSILLLDAAKKGTKHNFTNCNVTKKAENICGESYIKEFADKQPTDIKDFVSRFFLLKKQLKDELDANLAYKSASQKKKDMEEQKESDKKK